MKTQIKDQNSQCYSLEFSDSYYRFDEDLDETIEQYCSLKKVQNDDVESLLFLLHSHISKLRTEDGIGEDILRKYGLDDYGNGPQYEDKESFHILSGEYTVQSIKSDFITLISNMDGIELTIKEEDVDWILNDQIDHLEKGQVIIFDGMTSFIFVNDRKKDSIISKLTEEIKKLNHLFIQLNLKERVIELVNPK